MKCYVCDKPLDSFDVGCYKKLISRGARECMCRDCLARDLGWTRESLDAMIQRFREQGCMLFPPLEGK